MGFLSALFLARAVDGSVAKHTSHKRRKDLHDLALMIAWAAGVVFFIGVAFILDLLGVGYVSWWVIAALTVVTLFVIAGVYELVFRGICSQTDVRED